MEYVFFDIECCDGRNICSFGYIITNKHFKILKKEDIVINPRAGRKLAPGSEAPKIDLFYTDEQFKAAPDFRVFYPFIKDLLENPNRTVVGFSATNDAHFIKYACCKYKLPYINFAFYDIQRIYGKMKGAKAQVGLDTLAKNLGLSVENLHKSDDDAKTTLNITKKLAEEKNYKDMDAFIDSFKLCYATSIDGDIRYAAEWDERKKIVLGANMKGLNYAVMRRVVSDAAKTPASEKRQGVTGKVFLLSRVLEKKRYKETVVLIYKIARCGGIYESKVSAADYYVEYGKDSPARMSYIESRKDKIKVISFEEFIKLLGYTEESLKQEAEGLDLKRYLRHNELRLIES